MTSLGAPAPKHDYLADVPFVAMAHRGGAAENTENSATAFAHAVGLGFRYIETDVRSTHDGVVVIHHDANLERTTDGQGLLSSRSWSDVCTMQQASGDHPMSLTDALDAFPDTRFNIDCKDDVTVPHLLATLEKLGRTYFPRLCVASFRDDRVAAVQRHFGGAVATSAGSAEVVAWIRTSYMGKKIATTASIAAQVPVTVLGLPLISARFLATATRLNCHVHAWTVNDEPTMARLIDAGVHGIVTDQPTLLREVLTARGLWFPA